MIIIDSNIPLLPNVLTQHDEVLVVQHSEITNRLLTETGCTELFVRSTTKVNATLLQHTNVRFVGTATSGTDHIDTTHCTEHNITVTSAAGSNANSVAEYVVFGILQYCENINVTPDELTIGIIGFGNVGKLVGYYSHMIGLDVLINDPLLRQHGLELPEWIDEYCELESLLANADIVTTHVPLTTTGEYPTHNLLNWTTLDEIQESSLVISTSRGSVVQESALIFHAEEKGLSLITDVWENEPSFNSKLAEKSFLATPHVAGHSYDGKLRGSLMMAQTYAEYKNVEVDTSIIQQALQGMSVSISTFNNYTKLKNNIDTSRNITDDSAKFKSLLQLNVEDKQRAFAEFRGNYPIRRESIKP